MAKEHGLSLTKGMVKSVRLRLNLSAAQNYGEEVTAVFGKGVEGLAAELGNSVPTRSW